MPRYSDNGWYSSSGSSRSSRETYSNTSSTSSEAPSSGLSDAGTFKATHYTAPKTRCAHRECGHHHHKPSHTHTQTRGHNSNSSTRSERAYKARTQLCELRQHGTLAKIRGRISRVTGIREELFRGVCVHALLRMYSGCGYDARVVSSDARCEAGVLRRLRKEGGEDGDREAFKKGLVKVVARVLGWCEDCVIGLSDRRFRETAVHVVCGIAKNRSC